MKSVRKITALLLTLSIIFLAFSFSASAASLEDLESAVALMRAVEGYSNREMALLNAIEIFDSLDDAEKERGEAIVLYYAISNEREELDEIKDKAIEFIELVATVSDVAVGDKMVVIERIEAIEVDETYPGVAEAIETLLSIKAAHIELVENCLLFIDAVSVVEMYSTEEYLELKEAIAEAERYLSLINKDYPGVVGAFDSYTSIVSMLNLKEKYTQGVVNRIEAMISAETYAEKLLIKNEIANLLRSDNYLPDYEGLTDQLLDRMAETEEYMGQCVIKATRFILMVEAVAGSQNYRGALIACYPYLEGVDITVDGAEAAMDSFDEMVEEYNEAVSFCNSFMSGK